MVGTADTLDALKLELPRFLRPSQIQAVCACSRSEAYRIARVCQPSRFGAKRKLLRVPREAFIRYLISSGEPR